MPRRFEKYASSSANHADKCFVNEFEVSAAAYPDGRIAVLLSYYPDLSREELKEVIGFVRLARDDQIRRLRSTPRNSRKLDKVLRDNRALMPSPHAKTSSIVAAVVIMSILLWMLWDKRPHPLAPVSHQADVSRQAGTF
ncbi:hypothetical protein [Sphingobium herbicidovorans]|uniref:hypothetical protein n=1 Tax=Sphingobium herbicidovorans TaxID=76947 RepID=UPI000A4819F9|nr:hypothetical protein [Sphingobium herbicidovorans]